MVEVVSSLERDGRPVFRDLRWGVYVVLEAPTAIRRGLLRAVRPDDRLQRPLRGDVQALSPDRPRARHLRALGGVARRADRAADRVSRRRRRGRQARLARRRDAGRRGRLHRVGQAAAGGDEPARRRAADRAGAQGAAQDRHRAWRGGALVRRRDRCEGRCRRHRGARWKRALVRRPTKKSNGKCQRQRMRVCSQVLSSKLRRASCVAHPSMASTSSREFPTRVRRDFSRQRQPNHGPARAMPWPWDRAHPSRNAPPKCRGGTGSAAASRRARIAWC